MSPHLSVLFGYSASFGYASLREWQIDKDDERKKGGENAKERREGKGEEIEEGSAEGHRCTRTGAERDMAPECLLQL